MAKISKWSGRRHTRGGNVTVTNKYGDVIRVEHAGKWKIGDERLMYQTLNQMYPDQYHIDHHRPDWLKNPTTGHNLELDRYYPWLKLAFEYNGRHHQGKYQQYKDAIKRAACKERGIALVIIKSANRLDPQAIRWEVHNAKAELVRAKLG